MNISVIGAGRVGLVVAAGLADFGLNIFSVDSDQSKIDRLQRGELPFYEPGLRELVEKNRSASRLHFTVNLADAIHKSLVLYIAVGTEEVTPGKPNLGPLFEVSRAVGKLAKEYKVMAIKSTVPIGTAVRVIAELRKTTKIPCDVVSNPEFLREGSAIENFLRPERVILGGSSQQALAIMRDIYRPLYLLDTPIIATDHTTAELIKYATNAFLATKITFINEMANLCDVTGADVHMISKGLGLDRRIGPKFLHPGPGYGGSCLPKDTRTLSNIAQEHGLKMNVVDGTIEANDAISSYLVGRLKKMLGNLKGKIIGVLGLSYKPFTDDVRESPAIRFVQALTAEGAQVQAHDPMATDEAVKVFGENSARFFSNPFAAATDAHAVAILTEWNEFRNLDLAEVRRVMKGNILLDTRNIYEPTAAMAQGFRYAGRGRGSISSRA